MRPVGPVELGGEQGPGPSGPGLFSYGDSMGRPNELARSDQRELRSDPPGREIPTPRTFATTHLSSPTKLLECTISI